MKRVLTIVCFFVVVGLFGCSSNQVSSSVDDSQVSNESYLELETTDVSTFDGVTFPVDPKWSVLDFNDYNVEYFFKGESDAMTAYSIDVRGYLNHETKDLITFESTWDYKTDYEVIEEWQDEECAYSIFARTADKGTWVAFLTGYRQDGKGFSVDFTLGEYSETTHYVNDVNKNAVVDYFKSINWNPDETIIDSYDAYVAQKKDSDPTNTSSSSSNTATSPTPTTSQSNALKMAKQYLDYTAFSYTGLIEQLEYEGFSAEDATYGADNCGADWTVQADKMAKQYMEYSAFSRQGLIEQLEYEGFTPEQAAHGATSVGL